VGAVATLVAPEDAARYPYRLEQVSLRPENWMEP
jgi:hypothetical protein